MRVCYSTNNYYNRTDNVALNRKTTFKPVNDTVSFTSMKKSEFKGCDVYVVEKYKAPVEKFNSNDDLQSWAGGKCKRMLERDYQGRTDEIVKDRKKILKEWFKYVTDKNTGYTKAQQFIILNGITKDLGAEDANYPPVLNKGALADTIEEIEQSNNTQLNFSKIYRNKLQSLAISGDKTCGDYTGWIEIPSRSHDFWHFKDNVKKLQTLSHKNWCVKSYMAKPYLKKGDFHIYMEKGEPKMALRFEDRFNGNMIVEIQGQKNNGDIPWQYLDQYDEHIADLKTRKNKGFFGLFKNNLYNGTSARLKSPFRTARYIKNSVDKIKKDYAEDIKNNNAEKILSIYDSDVKKDKDGMLIVSHYKQPNKYYTFSDLGIDENEMFKQIKHIKGEAVFKNSKLKTLHNLERIDGEADFEYSNIVDTGNLKRVGKDIRLRFSNLKELKNIEIIKGNISVDNCKLESLGKLKIIGGDAYFGIASLQDLGQLERVCGEMIVSGSSNITSLGNLKRVRALGLVNSNVVDLGNLERIDGNAVLFNTKFDSLCNLKYIGGNVDFSNRWAIHRKPVTLNLKDLGKLEKIDGSAYIPPHFPLKEQLDIVTEGGTYIVK